jgi:hypothetical protein
MENRMNRSTSARLENVLFVFGALLLGVGFMFLYLYFVGREGL